MANTPTTRGRYQKQATGDNFNSWGTELNAGVVDMVDESIHGVETITVNGDATLTSNNYISDQARNRVFRLVPGAVAAPFTVTLPATEDWHIVDNATAYDCTLTPSGGTGAVIPAGRACKWYTNGTIAYAIDPVATATAATAASATAAAGSATAAANSATAAANSATASANSATASATSATSSATSATSAASSASQAAASAAGVNLPAVTAADAGKALTVNSAGSGYVVASGASLTDARTMWVEIAKLKGTFAGLAAGIVDDYKDQTGINTGSSVNAAYDSANNLYANRSVDTYTTALFHLDGTNGSTTFTEEKGKTVTNTGSVTVSTAQSKFGGASGLFGSGKYLSVPNSADLNMGTGNFTIEAFIYPTAVGPSYIFQKDGQSGVNFEQYQLMMDASRQLVAVVSNAAASGAATTLTSAATVTLNTWSHVALERLGNVFTVYLNGVSVATATVSIDLTSTNLPLRIGTDRTLASSFTGHIDEIRISKGTARYGGAFTPPTAAFDLFSSTPAVMDLRSATFTAAAVPTTASLFLEVKPTTGTITANTNLLGKISRDGGTTETLLTLIKTGTLSDGTQLFEANAADISGQPSGTSMRYRAQTVGTADGVEVRAAVFQWG
jgi:hypothetical protein